MRAAAIYLFIIMFLPQVLFGQEFTYTQYDIKEGIAGSVVYSIAQDDNGFMWFGTETGLSRFDGSKFKNFSTPEGLPGTEVLNVYPDSKGRVWMVPFKKAICFYYKDKIHNQINDSLLKKIELPGSVMYYAEASDRSFLVLGQEFLLILDSNLNKTAQFSGKDFNSNYFVNCSKSISGGFNILCNNGLFEILNGKVLKRMSFSVFTPHFNSSFLSSETLIYRNSLYKVSIVDLKTYSIKEGPFLPGLNKLCYLKNDYVVFNTPKGAAFHSSSALAKGNDHYLPAISVSNTFEDAEGNLWFSSIGNGVFKLNSTDIRTVSMVEDKGRKVGVTSLYVHDNFIFCGTELNSIHKFRHSEEGNVIRYFNERIDVMLSSITDLKVYNNKYLLYGTGMNIVKTNISGKLIDTIGSVSVKQIVPNNNRILVATGNHLLDVEVEKFSNIDTIWHGRTTSVAIGEGAYYIGTVNGLIKKSLKGEVRYFAEEIPLLSIRITAIKRDYKGGFWIATFGNGIVYLLNDQVVFHISEANGLSSNTCKSIFIDGDVVWAGTNKGLNKIVNTGGENFNIQNFYVSDGLASETINTILVHKGAVYVGTPLGLSFFNDQLLGSSSSCLLRWTSVKLGSRSVDLDSSSFVLLPPLENSVRFDFVGISYRSNGSIKYFYRLGGLDSSWQSTSETFVSYPSLPAGRYTFQVKAVNKYGVYSRELSLDFEIEPHWWERIWFRVLLILFMISCLFIGVKLYARYLQKKSAEKNRINQRMAELEQLALRSQMNPHFIFNSLNSIQQYVMDKDIEGANRFISAFSKLIRQTLDFSSRSQITIQEEIEYLRNYLELEKTRLEDQFDYVIHVQDSLEMTSLFIPPMILQPYIENSIRHGVRYRHDGKGLIALSISIQENRLVCEIVDNGMGRTYTIAHKSAMPIEYQSKGMTLTENRVNILNKVHKESIEVLIEDAFPNDDSFPGTRVLLKFPL